ATHAPDEPACRIDCRDILVPEQTGKCDRETPRTASDVERALPRTDACNSDQSWWQVLGIAPDVALVGIGRCPANGRHSCVPHAHRESLAPFCRFFGWPPTPTARTYVPAL